MYKTIAQSLTTFIFLIATHVYALPIIEADAFTKGDHQAVLDTTTNLTWLDFGVNNGASFNSVMEELGTTYLGWRLPTESEVRKFWGTLFTGALSTDEQYEICNLWGANKTPSDHTPFQAYGHFIDDNGYLGHGSFIEGGTKINHGADMFEKFYVDGTIDGYVNSGSGVKYDGSSYPPFNFWGIDEISTLLVKDGATANVPEPSTTILFGLGLFTLLLRRRYMVK